MPIRVLGAALVVSVLLTPARPATAWAAPEVVAPEPDRRGALSEDRTVDIESLALDLRVDLIGGTVEGTATHVVRPLRTGLRELRLHAIGLEVSSVTIDGIATTARVLPRHLAIALPEPSGPVARHTVVIAYSAAPDTGLHFRRPGPDSPDTYLEAWSQGEDVDNRNWFPCWDQPDDRFTYTGRFTVQDRFSVLSNGRLVDKEEGDRPGWTAWTYALQDQDLVSYLVMVAIAEYSVIAETWRDRPLLTWVPPGADPAAARRVTEKTAAMLDFMSSATGVEYPYPGYSQVFVQRFIFTGMENTTATVLSDRLMSSEAAAAHAHRTESVVAHELAHQWFGDQLTLRDWSHMWLNEGITTFLQSWWTQYSDGAEVWADQVFARNRAVIAADKRSPKPLVVDFRARDAGARHHHAYYKGSALMHMLRALLGEQDFGRGFQRYASDHQHSDVTTEDVQRAFEDTSGQDLDWFFQQWVSLAGHPRLEVAHAVDTEEGTVRVTLAQTQTVGGLVPLFTLPVDLLVGTDAGVLRRRVWMDGEASAATVIELPGALAWVAVDPDAGLLADIAQTQSDSEWAALLRSDAPAYARRLAFHAVETRKGAPSEQLRATVVGILMDAQVSPVWRRRAVEALAAWKDEASRATLVAALGPIGGQPSPGAPGIEGDLRLQESLVDGLGAGEPADDATAALRAAWKRGGSDQVRGSAVQALSRLVGERSLPELRRLLAGPAGEEGILHRVAVDALGSHGERADLDRIGRLRTPATEHSVRTSALWASAKIAGREPAGTKRDAARALVARDADANLHDLNLRGLQSAIGVLELVGDDTSVRALQALARRTHVEALHRQVEGAVEAIRTRRDKDPEPVDGALSARLQKLEERIEALRSQLTNLEEAR